MDRSRRARSGSLGVGPCGICRVWGWLGWTRHLSVRPPADRRPDYRLLGLRLQATELGGYDFPSLPEASPRYGAARDRGRIRKTRLQGFVINAKSRSFSPTTCHASAAAYTELMRFI